MDCLYETLATIRDCQYMIIGVYGDTPMVRAFNKIYMACQYNPAGHSARREKKRQTEKEMGGQHPGMDWHDAGRRHEFGCNVSHALLHAQLVIIVQK